MWWFAVVAGCAGEKDAVVVDGPTDADTDADADGDTDTDTDSDTDAHTGEPVPTTLNVSCAGTDNVLRFTCTVDVDPPQPVTLTASRAADGTGTRTVEGADAVAQHVLNVVFLAPTTEYTVEASASGTTATTSFVTGAAPVNVASSLTVTGTATTPYLGSNLPCTPNAAVAAVWDTATGELVWYHLLQSPGSLFGYSMVQYTEDHTVLGITGSRVVEIDLMGADLLRAPYDEDYNHDLFRRDDKTWIIYSANAGGRFTLQGVVVWDLAGNELARFFQDEWPIPGDAAGDWSHTNSVYVDDQLQMWLSLYTQNTIVKADGDPASPTFGQIEWVLAGDPPNGLGQDFSIDWSAVGGDDSFGRQHNALIRADGRLLMLDNAHGRGLTMSIDEANRTATVDEEYATGAIVCGPQGTSMETASGHVLVGCSGMNVREYDGANVVFEGELRCDNGIGAGGGGGPGGAVRWYPLDGW